MTDDEDALVAAYPEYLDLQRLADLRGAGGWQFTIRHDEDGKLGAFITGLRPWPDGSVDLLVVRNFTAAQARRSNPAGGVVWRAQGGLGETIDSLLELPPPDDPNAPTRVISSGPGIWTSG